MRSVHWHAGTPHAAARPAAMLRNRALICSPQPPGASLSDSSLSSSPSCAAATRMGAAVALRVVSSPPLTSPLLRPWRPLPLPSHLLLLVALAVVLVVAVVRLRHRLHHLLPCPAHSLQDEGVHACSVCQPACCNTADVQPAAAAAVQAQGHASQQPSQPCTAMQPPQPPPCSTPPPPPPALGPRWRPHRPRPSRQPNC